MSDYDPTQDPPADPGTGVPTPPTQVPVELVPPPPRLIVEHDWKPKQQTTPPAHMGPIPSELPDPATGRVASTTTKGTTR